MDNKKYLDVIDQLHKRLSAMDAKQLRAQAKPEVPAAAVAMSDALSPGEAPVDVERVDLIRKAVESGTYPIVPTRIADAMIAAGYLLRSGK